MQVATRLVAATPVHMAPKVLEQLLVHVHKCLNRAQACSRLLRKSFATKSVCMSRHVFLIPPHVEMSGVVVRYEVTHPLFVTVSLLSLHHIVAKFCQFQVHRCDSTCYKSAFAAEA